MSDRSARPAVTYPLTIYFDSACPICRTEMTTLAALDVDDRLVLVDCSTGPLDAACVAAGLDRVDLTARIHARDAIGRWLTGVDVFVAAYDAAGLAALAALFANRRLRPLSQRLYPWIARNRYRLSRLGLQHLFKLIPHRVSTVRRAAAREGCGDASCGQAR